jgi:hypothetical protein
MQCDPGQKEQTRQEACPIVCGWLRLRANGQNSKGSKLPLADAEGDEAVSWMYGGIGV